MGERVLIVGGGLFQLAIIRAAKQLGVEAVVVDRRADAPGMALADHALAIDTRDTAAVLAAARGLGVRGVVTAASDVAVGAVARVVDALELSGIGAQVAARGRDKLQSYQHLSQAGLAAPRTLLIASASEAAVRARELGGYPIVIKPRSSAGGRGVAVVNNELELAAAITRAEAHADADKRVLLQAYVGGLSVGAEAFFWDGALAECFVLNDQYQPGFVSPVGHSLPCSLAAAEEAAVKAAVARFGAAIGITHGPANFDLRLTPEGPVMIEVNMRLGGNSITELIELAFGTNLSRAAVCAALGRDPLPWLARRDAQPAAARLIMKRGHGIARVLESTRAIASLPGVVSLELSVIDGERSTIRVDEWSLIGRSITRADSAAAAEALAERVAAAVTQAIVVEP